MAKACRRSCRCSQPGRAELLEAPVDVPRLHRGGSAPRQGKPNVSLLRQNPSVLIDHWPLLGLRLRTARLELRLPSEDELAELADVAAQGIHEPGTSPFLRPWTEVPPRELAREVLQRHWRRRGAWTPQGWALELAVFKDGHPVGVQELWADNFPTLREVATGSWLGLKHHGQGVGTEMRSAVLHLAFAGLRAEQARMASFVNNPAPLAVSRKLGYQPDGITRDVLHGQAVVSERLRLTRQDWESRERPQVTISGLKPCLSQFGVDAETPHTLSQTHPTT